MGPCFKSYLSCNFDQPERIHDRAIINLAGHHFQRLSENKIILSPHINQKLFVGREVVSLSCTSLWGSNGGAVVRALASHQCGLGTNPGIDAICGLSLLLVLSLAPRGFFPGTPVFPSP